jgi:hypothetical protein
MKYIVSWTLPQSTYRSTIARFLETGGMPPAPVKLLGRWHGMNGAGFAVVETTDAKALYAWFSEWSEFLPINTTPCLEDADAATVLKSIKR